MMNINRQIQIFDIQSAIGFIEQIVFFKNTFLLFILLIFAVGIIAYLVIKRGSKKPNGKNFRKKLKLMDAIVILTHPNPDPDAMAAAIGVAHIAESVGVFATIQYPGEIRHQENRAFKTVLEASMERIESVEDIARGAVILVDHNTARGFDGSDKIVPFAIIDHHPGMSVGTGFTDIRPDYGSCSTIVAEYFLDLGAVLRNIETDYLAPGHKGGNKIELPSNIATGLLYGILSDTKNLTKGATQAEFNASAYLYKGIDEDRLDRIANPEVDTEVLEIVARAILKRESRGPFIVSNVGEVSNVDAIPQAADELLGLEGTTAVVVYGQKGSNTHISGRSRDDRVHMGETLKTALSTIPDANAGGHARSGGGQITAATKKINKEYGKGIPELLFLAMNGKGMDEN